MERRDNITYPSLGADSLYIRHSCKLRRSLFFKTSQWDIQFLIDNGDVKMESDSGISVNLSHFDGGTVRRGGGGGDPVTVQAQVINGGLSGYQVINGMWRTHNFLFYVSNSV